MLVCVEASFKPEDPETLARETNAWSDEMESSGAVKIGSRLRPYAEAKTLRVRDDKRLLGSGLFEGLKDRIAGFDIISAVDLDAAIEIAAKHPMAKLGTMEIRELC